MELIDTLPNRKPRCQGITKAGTQCGKSAIAGGSRCAQHPLYELDGQVSDDPEALIDRGFASAHGWTDEQAENLIAQQEAAQRAAREAEAALARARYEKKRTDNSRIMRHGRTVAFERSVPHATPRSSAKGTARRERKLALQRKRGFGGGR